MNKRDTFKKIIVESYNMKIGLTRRDLDIHAGAHKVTAIYGPRRCGKTYLFYQVMQDLAEKRVPPKNIFYINFEDERILPFEKEDWEILLDAYFELYPDNVKEKNYLFLDEIQEIPFWEKFVRRLSEKGNFQIFLTGSSSKLLAKEIATTLRGRAMSYFLMSFSFKEFLKFKNVGIDKRFEYSSMRHAVKKLFSEYLKFGGFPEILDKDDAVKLRTLQSYFDLIFYKDIVERYKIRNFRLMKDLMRYLLSNFSALFSVTNYYNHIKSAGQKIGKDTLSEYLFCLEEVNFVKPVSLFDYSVKKQTVNPKKIYCIDTGLVTASSFQFSENSGKYLENLVFLELLRRGAEIYYYKDLKGNEVDFLITEKGRPRSLIQVTKDIGTRSAKNREAAPLIGAAKRFKIKECFILTEDDKTEMTEGNLKIKILPLWSWLLE